MAKRTKLIKFAEVKQMSNVFETPETFNIKEPYLLELACGKGHYTVALAKENPKLNHIGVDLKADRIWYGASEALQEGIANAFFIRSDIRKIQDYIPNNSVQEIWITFPGPFPRKKHAKHRLTHIDFLKIYKQILKPNGIIHLKTDDPALFEFTQEQIKEIGGTILELEPDIYNQGYKDSRLEIKTQFETKWLNRGKTINHLSFKLS